MEQRLRDLFCTKDIVYPHYRCIGNHRQEQQEQHIVTRCGRKIAVEKSMESTLRAAARAKKAGKPIKRTGRKKTGAGRIEIKIQ